MSSPNSLAKPVNGREAVLAAAVRVIARDGILAMTIEAVAREAGLSKGGALYHFASKDALLRGMLEHFLSEFEKHIAEEQAADPVPQGRWMRSYLKAFFAGPKGAAADLPPSEQRNLHVALFTSVMIHRDLLAVVVKRFYESWRPAAENDGVPQLEQWVTWLAADGLGVWQMLGVIPHDGPEQNQLLQALLERTRKPATSEERL